MTRLLDTQTVSMLLADAAGRVDALTFVKEIDASTWGLAFEEVADCLLELEPGGKVLTASIDLGIPAEDCKASVQSAALTFNALWREMQGMRIAQVGPEGELILLRQFTADEVFALDFATALGDFGHTAALWGAYVTHGTGGHKAGSDIPFMKIPSGARV